MGLPVKSINSKFRAEPGTVGTAAQQLTTIPFSALKSVYIKCTTGTIYVGTTANVTASNGYPLVAAGDNAVELNIDDPSKVWVIGAAGGQVYKWIAS